MTTPAPVKTCTICRRELVNVPRVKDPKGHYFCEPCYAQARQKRQALVAETAYDEPAIDDSHPVADEDSALDLADTAASGLTADMGAFETRAADFGDAFDPASSQHAARRCPQCRSIIAADARFCANCGANVEVEMEQEALATPVREKHIKMHSLIGAETGRNWPVVVGSICVFASAFEIAANATIFVVCAVRIVTADDIGAAFQDWRLSGPLGVAAILLGLCWWLINAGRSLQYRAPAARLSLLRWGAIKMLVSIGAFTAAVVASEHGFSDELVMSSAVYLVWLLLWPTFILFWTTRPDIRREMLAWGARPGTVMAAGTMEPAEAAPIDTSS